MLNCNHDKRLSLSLPRTLGYQSLWAESKKSKNAPRTPPEYLKMGRRTVDIGSLSDDKGVKEIIELTAEELNIMLYVLTKFMIEYHSAEYPNVFYQKIENLQNKIILIKELEKIC